MSDQTQALSRREMVIKSFADAATFFGSFGICAAAGHAFGPVGIGVASGLLAMPMISSGVTGMGRVVGQPGAPGYEEFARSTGLQMTVTGVKNCLTSPRKAGTLAAVMLAVGGFVGVTALSLKGVQEQAVAAQEAWQRRPVLAPETVLRTVDVTAGDSCVARDGKKLEPGTQVGVTHNGVQYRVICP